jgi:prevent-host-death family protein
MCNVGDHNVDSVSIRVAREKMSTIIEEVGNGHGITITKRGREVARIVPIRKPAHAGPVPDLSRFRKSIRAQRTGLADEVRTLRREERA